VVFVVEPRATTFLFEQCAPALVEQQLEQPFERQQRVESVQSEQWFQPEQRVLGFVRFLVVTAIVLGEQFQQPAFVLVKQRLQPE